MSMQPYHPYPHAKPVPQAAPAYAQAVPAYAQAVPAYPQAAGFQPQPVPAYPYQAVPVQFRRRRDRFDSPEDIARFLLPFVILSPFLYSSPYQYYPYAPYTPYAPYYSPYTPYTPYSPYSFYRQTAGSEYPQVDGESGLPFNEQ
ncbi:hypothetical protein LOK74_16700 [Brevibacillus humidisoli]|uniref:hypothetical protein n=1 Tax=Brevibacillus humidisoli TaxID=2895522 RepID=UPI001E2CC5FA|nr:hypothetical protein [Brevibacillus humidisoli]UFJ39683.1 hypothetical protein LOK74_16700 [Brevibacillus humidisoli]